MPAPRARSASTATVARTRRFAPDTRGGDAPALPPSVAAPRHAHWLAALVYALSTLSLSWRALGGQFAVNLHSDQYIGGYAFRLFAAQSLRAGHGFPQWNPYFFGGMPYIAAMHGDIFYPTFLLRLVLPTDVAMTWGFIVHLFLAGLFTYFFLRACRLEFFPALVGGLAYMLTGIVASYVSPGHDGKLFVSALTPLALWQLVRAIRDGRAWAWGVFALTVGLAVLSPHPQLLQYMLLLCGAFALYVAFADSPDGGRLPRDVALRRLALALGAVVLGALIGAVQYLPVREYVAWSPRAGGTPYDFATTYSFPPEELINTWLPQFSGILGRYWGRNGIHLHSEFLGVVTLFLAPLALVNSRRKGFTRFWLGVAIVSLVWALGGYTPFFHLVYAVVPGTRFFRAPSTIFYITAFSVAMLAALGMERLLDAGVGARYAYGWMAAAAVVVLLAATGALTNFSSAIATIAADDIARLQGLDPARASDVAAALAARAHANYLALLLGAWRSLAFTVAAAGFVLAWTRGRIAARTLAWGLVATMVIDFWSIDRLYWMFMPPAPRIFASDPAIDYLKHQTQPGRVLVLARGDSGVVPRDPYFGTDHLGKGSGFMVHGVRTLTGYHSNELGRYQELGGAAQTGTYRFTVVPLFWRHENARWLYTNLPFADTAFKLVVGPVHNSAGSTAYLYALPGDNPYAWLAATTVAAPDSLTLSIVTSGAFGIARVAIFDTASHLGQPPHGAMPAAATVQVRTTSFGPGRASLLLDGPAPGGSALVVAENYYPGWHASVDGKPAPVGRADYNLIGVPLPAGARRVELTFEDPAYAMGKLVTLLALAATLALIVGGVVREGRATVAARSSP